MDSNSMEADGKSGLLRVYCRNQDQRVVRRRIGRVIGELVGRGVWGKVVVMGDGEGRNGRE